MLRHVTNDAVGELVHLRRREREAARAHANAVHTLESGGRRSVNHSANLGRIRLEQLRRWRMFTPQCGLVGREKRLGLRCTGGWHGVHQ
eukprot:7112526-Prymnesium_polylepis.1